MGLKVYKSCCKNCLLSEDRIVSPKRAKEIIKGCVQEQSYFTCHKATIEGKEIMCCNFYESLGHKSQLVRIAERLGAIEFIEQSDSEKLSSHKEMSSRIRKANEH